MLYELHNKFFRGGVAREPCQGGVRKPSNMECRSCKGAICVGAEKTKTEKGEGDRQRTSRWSKRGETIKKNSLGA